MTKEKTKTRISGEEVRRQLEEAKLEVSKGLYRMLAKEFANK